MFWVRNRVTLVEDAILNKVMYYKILEKLNQSLKKHTYYTNAIIHHNKAIRHIVLFTLKVLLVHHVSFRFSSVWACKVVLLRGKRFTITLNLKSHWKVSCMSRMPLFFLRAQFSLETSKERWEKCIENGDGSIKWSEATQ